MKKEVGSFNALMDMRSLAQAASNSGIQVPDDPENFSAVEYPHFAVYAQVQMCRVIPEEQPSAHWHNARLIRTYSDEDIQEVSIDDLEPLLK